MASTDYLAQFRADSGEFFARALRWPASTSSLLPPAWWGEIRQLSGVDVGLRLVGGVEPKVLMLLSSSGPHRLTTLLEATDKSPAPAGLVQPENAVEFDKLTNLNDADTFVRVCHDGFHYSGSPLGCDFRLYASWMGQGLPEGVGYQLVLRPFNPDREQERHTRKYLAWLNLEKPFTPAVRAVQELLCRRLLAPGWLADEYLFFRSSSLSDEWLNRIRDHFSDTSGRMGFAEAPVKSGDFHDWISIGCHTARDSNTSLSLPVQGACTFTQDELEWFITQDLTNTTPPADHKPPDIFVSYASADFAHADLVRQHLEGNGWRCWIAPRDINSTGLSYTEAIPQAVKQVSAVIVMLSPSANLSVHIPRELDLALEHRRPIIPVRLADIQPSGQLNYLLRTCQWLNEYDRDHNSAMNELVVRLRSLGL